MLGSNVLGSAYLGFSFTGSTGTPTAVRVSQVALEVVEAALAAARLSQLATEVLRSLPPTNAVTTQLAVEVLIPYRISGRFYAQIV